jgi:sugar diacid utilization regulator
VAILSSNLSELATYPRHLEFAGVISELRRLFERSPQGISCQLVSRNGWVTAQPVRVGIHNGGWVCVFLPEAPTPMTEIVTGSASVHTALWQVQAEAAEQALAEAKEKMLWDLLDGTADQRRAAAIRATRMRIDLQRPTRVIVGSVHGLQAYAADQRWDTTRVDEYRRSLRARFTHMVTQQMGAELADMQSERFVAIVPDVSELETLVDRLDEQLLPDKSLSCQWGVSSVHTRPDELGVAVAEARAAMRVAARLGRKRWAVFDRLGLVQYLVGPVDSAGLDEFATEVIGPLVAADEARPGGGELVATLRAYLEANCSQQAAAQRLYIHHKTMRYRLERIEKLSGLDLRSHDDRVRADLALRIREMITDLITDTTD